ncbi:MAG: SDR family NAD(P)-dependent oxidoreductase [Deltaproteobacteria bacterium]|nr:MAG: SDR family NAD(P)-dependent oxidoreductase [Deltaproteobacteria bacterium]
MGKKPWTSEQIPDQSGRTAVVTGANSGIGYETAKALAAKGARVVMACRSRQRAQRAVEELSAAVPGANVEVLELDLASLDSVARFAEELRERCDRIDLLINNAGVMMPPSRQETADGFELQFGVNHLGHFALTLRLLETIVATNGSRIVTVSSSAQNYGELDLDDLNWTRRPFKRWASYGASKIANMLFTLELQRRLSEAGVSTIAAAAHPGWTATNLQRTSPLFRALNPIVAMKPWQGALPTLYAAVAAEVVPGGYYGPDGLGNMRGYPCPNQPAKASQDTGTAKRLWEISEELTGVTTPDLGKSGRAATG